MSRPELSFSQGKWTLTDADAGYSRVLELWEVDHLIADAFQHFSLTMRTASARRKTKAKIPRSELKRRFDALAIRPRQ